MMISLLLFRKESGIQISLLKFSSLYREFWGVKTLFSAKAVPGKNMIPLQIELEIALFLKLEYLKSITPMKISYDMLYLQGCSFIKQWKLYIYIYIYIYIYVCVCVCVCVCVLFFYRMISEDGHTQIYICSLHPVLSTRVGNYQLLHTRKCKALLINLSYSGGIDLGIVHSCMYP